MSSFSLFFILMGIENFFYKGILIGINALKFFGLLTERESERESKERKN